MSASHSVPISALIGSSYDAIGCGVASNSCTAKPSIESFWQTRRTLPPVNEIPRRSTMGLREKYEQAIQIVLRVNMQGDIDERDGKLYFKGTTRTQIEANQIWGAIK